MYMRKVIGITKKIDCIFISEGGNSMAKSLSTREREVAILVSKGMKDVEIAKALYISRRRVGELIASIKEKWEIKSRVEIGIGVYFHGWVMFKDDIAPSKQIFKINSRVSRLRGHFVTQKEAT